MSVVAADTTTSRSKWRVFAVLASAAALTILDVSKLGVALPAIQDAMGGSPATVQLMLVGYTIAYAATLLPAGRIGDVLPRKAVFITGLSVFLVASIACTFAPSVEWLVAARIIEGVGAGLLMPQVLGIIQRTFPARERAKPLAALAAITTLTSLAAPVLAGVILQAASPELGWRILFLVTVVAAAVVLPFAIALIHEPTSERRLGFDWLGAALLAAGVLCAIAPLSSTSELTDIEPWMGAVTVGGLALLAAFTLHERRQGRRGAEALIDPALLRLQHLKGGVLISGFMHAAGTGGTLIVTIALQQITGLTALETALWMLPSAAASILGAWIASRLNPTNGRIIAIGTLMGGLALIGLGFVFGATPAAATPALVACLLTVSSFGAGVSAPSNQARTLILVPDYRSSVAGSLIQFSQRVGSALGMAIAMIVYYALFTNPTFAGEPAAGPMVALWVVACFLLAATATALLDMRPRRRTSRTPAVKAEARAASTTPPPATAAPSLTE